MRPMLLQLDAGNTRLKWRLLDPAAPPLQGVVLDIYVHDPERAAKCVAALLEDLVGAGVRAVQSVQVCSVRDTAFHEALGVALRAQYDIAPQYALTSAAAGGVRNGYQKPQSLGVDRWLAVLAAWARAEGACCVLDCGTTMTLDVVDGSGQHLGGFIVPGLQLQYDALGERSAALRAAASRVQLPPDAAALLPGTETSAAIGHGVLNMALGFVNLQHRKLLNLLDSPQQWFLTGGDAALLSAHIEWQHSVAPDLVLDGLGYF